MPKSKVMQQEDVLRVFPTDWLKPEPIDHWWEEKDGPLWIDLGAGMGRFLLAHAARHPDVRFLGIERKLYRVRKIQKMALQQNLDHIRMLRCEGYYAVRYLLPPNSVDRIYIYYPDPWPKARHATNRIMAPRFMDALATVLKPGAELQFATDHRPYFDQVMELWEGETRFEPSGVYQPQEDEISDFELMFREERPANRAALRKR